MKLVGHFSDHCPISFGFKCSYKTTEFKHDVYPLKPNFRRDDRSEFIYKSALSSDNIVNQINSILQSNETDVCIDEMPSKVENVLNFAAQRALKERKIGSKSKPKKKKWFDRNSYALRKEVIRLGRKLYRSKVMPEERMLFFSKKKELRKMGKFKKKEFRQNILNQLNNLEENNPKQYWKLVSELKELESRSSSNSDCVSAEEWINHFSKLLYNKNMENCSELESFFCNIPTAKTFTNLDYRITKDEIKTCISKLKSGKVVGMDTILSDDNAEFQQK